MIPKPEAKLEARAILDSIRRLVRSLRVFSRHSERRHNLSAAQIFVLQQLSATKPCTMKELAKRTFTDQSSVSTVVSRLVSAGLVLRRASQTDQRAVELRLSPSGLQLLKGQPDAFQSRVLKALIKMEAVERRGLKRGLEKLLEDAGMADEKPEMLFSEAEA